MLYFSMEFHDAMRARELLWAEDDATGRGRTWITDFFRGMQGQVWVQDPARQARLQAILDAHAIPYTATTERTDSDPFVEPFLRGY